MRKHRREGMELQLTAMIDIFTMIVIFLIKGTVMGASDMAVPSDMKLPKSYSHENVESAPQVVISVNEVKILSLGSGRENLPAVPLKDFKTSGSVASIEKLKEPLKAYIGQLTSAQRSGGVLLNVIADKKTPYADIFDVVKVFRQAGFESLLFIATGEKLPGDKGGGP